MRGLHNKFWSWYERNRTFNLGLAAFLFTLQIVHLTWLFGDVIYLKIVGSELFRLEQYKIASLLILVVDYLEVPAIITTSLVYLSELRQKINYKSLLFLVFVNSQWLHLFWITDEFVLEHITNHTGPSVLPLWLTWIAILIDYLELPVIYDTIGKFVNALKNKGILVAIEELKD